MCQAPTRLANGSQPRSATPPSRPACTAGGPGGMAAYVGQRLSAVIGIMVAMSILVFLATHALPSNAAGLILGQYSRPETQAALKHKLGLDQPLPVQYWHWASHM